MILRRLRPLSIARHRSPTERAGRFRSQGSRDGKGPQRAMARLGSSGNSGKRHERDLSTDEHRQWYQRRVSGFSGLAIRYRARIRKFCGDPFFVIMDERDLLEG